MNLKTKEKIYLISIALLIALCGQFYFTYRYEPAHRVQVFYNKETELNKEIMKVIREADEYIYFAIYTFTRNDIKDALLGAKYRNVKIIGITDKKQTADIELQNKIINELRKNEIPIYEQNHDAIMHLKTIISEKAYASGSYNWTASGTNSNDEVLEVGKDENIRKQYQAILEELIDRYE